MAWKIEKLLQQRLEIRSKLQADESVKNRGLEFLKSSYNHDYCYQWDWLGFPILQMPEDIVVMQEIVFRCKPSLIVETGVAWGGGLVLAGSLMSLYNPRGLVIGVDLNLDENLGSKIEDLNLPVRFDLIQGSSTAPEVVERVEEAAANAESVMVILDSSHTHDHVLSELNIYSQFVSKGQYLIVGDTSIKYLADQTQRKRDWDKFSNPASALDEFLAEHSDFYVDSDLDSKLLTSFHPGGYVRKK